MGKKASRAAGIIIGIPLFIFGLFIFLYGMFVPAIFAMPVLFIGVLLIIAGGASIWYFNRRASRMRPKVNY